MKKIILLILSLFILGGLPEPPEEKNYEVKIIVFYPTLIDTIVVKGSSRFYPELSSYKGSNFISGIYETTAPIKIISVKELSNDKKI